MLNVIDTLECPSISLKDFISTSASMHRVAKVCRKAWKLICFTPDLLRISWYLYSKVLGLTKPLQFETIYRYLCLHEYSFRISYNAEHIGTVRTEDAVFGLSITSLDLFEELLLSGTRETVWRTRIIASRKSSSSHSNAHISPIRRPAYSAINIPIAVPFGLVDIASTSTRCSVLLNTANSLEVATGLLTLDERGGHSFSSAAKDMIELMISVIVLT